MNASLAFATFRWCYAMPPNKYPPFLIHTWTQWEKSFIKTALSNPKPRGAAVTAESGLFEGNDAAVDCYRSSSVSSSASTFHSSAIDDQNNCDMWNADESCSHIHWSYGVKEHDGDERARSLCLCDLPQPTNGTEGVYSLEKYWGLKHQMNSPANSGCSSCWDGPCASCYNFFAWAAIPNAYCCTFYGVLDRA